MQLAIHVIILLNTNQTKKKKKKQALKREFLNYLEHKLKFEPNSNFYNHFLNYVILEDKIKMKHFMHLLFHKD